MGIHYAGDGCLERQTPDRQELEHRVYVTYPDSVPYPEKIRRTTELIEAVLVCIAVSIITFALIHWTGDLAVTIGGMDASKEETERLRRLYVAIGEPGVIEVFDTAPLRRHEIVAT